MQVLEAIEVKPKNDFITNIKYQSQTGSMIFIHQLPLLDVTLNLQAKQNYQLKFQSNIYDALILNTTLLVSNKNMPLRTYSITDQNSFDECRASIYDRKKNSELFLTPIQMASYCGKLLGGGKKFVSEYDLEKLVAKQMKQMDKKYISSVELLQPNLALAGSFTGDIELLDLNSGQIAEKIKPHMDLVTRLKRVPQSQTFFVSLARKDNICYFWDLRNLKNFLCCFQHPLYGNQRTGLQISNDGRTLLLGSQHGEIYIHNLAEYDGNYTNFSFGVNKCVSSISCTTESTYCSVGQRQFALSEEQKRINYVYRLSGI